MRHDAVIIGAGPNGLAAANRLVDAGWSVLVLEAQPTVGGAVRSDRDVHPDYVHDTFSAFYPLAVASPGLRDLDLERHGLTWSHAPAVLGHPFTDGSWALLTRDREQTAAWFDEEAPGDGEAWLALCRAWDVMGPSVIGALTTPFPPVRHGLGAAARLRKVGGLDFVRTLVTPVMDLGRDTFTGRRAATLLAGNAGHADLPFDAAGSGLMGLLMTMLGQTVGFPVPRGGAGELTRAMARRFESRGGQIRCHSEVTAIEVDRRKVTGVRTANGERIAATAVLADVSAPALYGALLDHRDVPAKVHRSMQRFQWDPATVKVDWALSGPVPWAGQPEVAPGTVHVADSIGEMSQATSQVAAGVVPAAPFMLAGQMTTSDATRSPAGTESLWAYTHVPQRVRDDAGGELTGTWDASDRERFADRMQERFERLAPGFGSRVVERRVLGPRELEERNANLVGGAIGGGTQQIHQQLVFRPVPGLGRAETPVRGLFLASASAHPGGGVHGAPGLNAARAAIARARRPLT